MADKNVCPTGAIITTLLMVVVLLATSVLRAQIVDEDGNARDTVQGVYVRDSGVVTEKLALAERMERLGEWNKSADVYQEILAKLADRVVMVSNEKGNEQYVGVALEVQKRLGKWPEAGIKAYNARYDTEAAGLLKEATDAVSLQQVFANFFATDSGRRAGMRLMDASLEAGDFLAAAWTGDRLLRYHPNLQTDRAAILYRAALAFHLAGDAQTSQKWAAELIEKFPDAPGTLRGTDVVLAKQIEEDRQKSPPVAQASSADSWPIFAGSNDRSRIGSGNGKPGAKTYSVPLRGLDPSPSNNPMVREQQLQIERRRETGQLLTVYPSIDRGQMFFQDGRRLYALHADNDRPLPGWAQSYPGDPEREGQFIINTTGVASAAQLTVTLTDDSVLAIMGQPDRNPALPQMQMRPTRSTSLVCLNRENGKERWTNAPRDIPESFNQLRAADMTGSPLVIGNNVYVVMRNSKGLQFNDSYVVCVDMATGKFKWATYIVSSTGQIMNDMMPGPLTETHLASLGGRIFVSSDLGAVASLDAASGQIIWLDLYPRVAADTAVVFPRRFRRQPVFDPNQSFKPWASNPAIVQSGRLFVLPTDGKFLHVYDAGTGQQVTRLDLQHFDGADTLLAVIGEKVIFCGDISVYCVDWQKYRAEEVEQRRKSSAIVWRKPFFEGNRVRGRGFVTSETVYIPTEKNINCIRMDNGKVEMSYPTGDRVWEDGEGPGNLLVLGEQVIVATDRAVVVYSELNVVQAKLDAEVAAAPDQPGPRLHYAEVMDTAGQSELSVTKLDEALSLIEGRSGPAIAEARDRAFDDCLRFARRLTKDPNNEPAMQRAVTLYDRAAKIASTPAQHATWRSQRARLAADMRDGELAVKLYQEILADETIRAAIVPAEISGSSLPASQLASSAITRLVRRFGPGIYAAFDREAAAALEAARPTANPLRLVSVAQQYPNSRSAMPALALAAEAYEANGDARQAVNVLRQIYFLNPEGPNTPVVLESMARNYLAMPGRSSSAIARLSQGVRFNNPKLTRPLRLPDGKLIRDVSFSDAVTELRAYIAREAPLKLPNVRLPVPGTGRNISRTRPFVEHEDAVIAGVSELVEQTPGFDRPDRFVLNMVDGSVQMFEVGNAQPKITVTGQPGMARGCAWIGGGLTLWTESQLSFRQPDSNSPAWKVDIRSLPAIETLSSPEVDAVDEPRDPNQQQVQQMQNRLAIAAARRRGRMQQMIQPAPAPQVEGIESITVVQPLNDRILLATSLGRVICIDPGTGKMLWQNRPTDKMVDRLVATDDFTAIRAADEMSAHIAVIDNFTGESIGRRYFTLAGSGNLPNNLALSVDGTLVYTMPDRIFIKDLYQPWKNEARRIESDAVDGPLNLGATSPEHLQVIDGRIIILADDGQTIRIHKLEDGRLLRFPGDENRPAGTATLRTGAVNWSVKIRVIGPRLYAMSPASVLQINLDKPSDQWQIPITSDPQTQRTFVELAIDPNYVIAVDEIGNTRNTRRVYAYGRYLNDERTAESGRLDYEQDIAHPTGIVWTRGVEGGLIYLSGDQRLHYLKTE